MMATEESPRCEKYEDQKDITPQIQTASMVAEFEELTDKGFEAVKTNEIEIIVQPRPKKNARKTSYGSERLKISAKLGSESKKRSGHSTLEKLEKNKDIENLLKTSLPYHDQPNLSLPITKMRLNQSHKLINNELDKDVSIDTKIEPDIKDSEEFT